MRLDIALVTWGLVPSRARAKDLIDRGLVTLNGDVFAKAQQKNERGRPRPIGRSRFWLGQP